jgi:hypothetical protein
VGRCFAPRAEEEILAWQAALTADDLVGGRAAGFALEGVQRIEVPGQPADSHTVFALAIALPPRTLLRRPEEP